MNQDILFADIQFWNSERQAVGFPAQQGGALIHCWVTRAWLEGQAGRCLDEESEILSVFSSLRFDLEDLAEAAIEDESFDAQGEIVLG
ncbi:transcriptional regulator [Photobacterium aquae]|uniref:Transcriptional regulator n=1 Tax=Photobacterium aquae TaxID=1195763 RepID=A0A0J1GUC0_9GAMM|nr:DUF1488 domain-containing protein [Photobacterium aquae]KLV03251.1 transcriptional regulator [Photobacterium aquae]